jgi:hypothetical protein
MPQVEFACEGRVLFRAASGGDPEAIPRLHEVVVIDERPYQVIDVEYWARRLGATDRRTLWPVVHLVPIAEEEWQRRLQRRGPAVSPPRRY